MRKGATYQQLRSHLAYLKLGAVAEALPAALEQAEKGKPSYTDFLHGLFDVEVEATERRRLAGRLRFASFPHARRSRSSTSPPSRTSTGAWWRSSRRCASSRRRPTPC